MLKYMLFHSHFDNHSQVTPKLILKTVDSCRQHQRSLALLVMGCYASQDIEPQARITG